MATGANPAEQPEPTADAAPEGPWRGAGSAAPAPEPAPIDVPEGSTTGPAGAASGHPGLARFAVFAGVNRRIIRPAGMGGMPCELVIDEHWISLASDRTLRTRWFDLRRADERHAVMLVGRRSGIVTHLRLRSSTGFAEVMVPPGPAHQTIPDALAWFGWDCTKMWS